MEVYINEYKTLVDLEENCELFDRFHDRIWDRVNATAGDWIEVNRDDEGWVYFIDRIIIEDDDLEHTIFVEGQYDYYGECGMVLGPYGEEGIHYG